MMTTAAMMPMRRLFFLVMADHPNKIVYVTKRLHHLHIRYMNPPGYTSHLFHFIQRSQLIGGSNMTPFPAFLPETPGICRL
jgi:hypothetical protein